MRASVMSSSCNGVIRDRSRFPAPNQRNRCLSPVSPRFLTELVEELRAALDRVPTDRAAEAEAVKLFTSDLIEKAKAGPNPSVLRIGANNLLDAARALADKAAPVVKLVEQILGLLGLG